MRDTQDSEDYSHFYELLKLKGLSHGQARRIVLIVKRKTRQKERAVQEAALIKAQWSPVTPKSALDCILSPADITLKSIPKYDRYVAYMLAEHGMGGAAERLGLPRRSLLRWLIRNGYRTSSGASYV